MNHCVLFKQERKCLKRARGGWRDRLKKTNLKFPPEKFKPAKKLINYEFKSNYRDPHILSNSLGPLKCYGHTSGVACIAMSSELLKLSIKAYRARLYVHMC